MISGIADAVSAADLGRPSARKAGRDPEWPYVPILITADGHERQLLGRAYATRDEAVAYAERHVRDVRIHLADRLAQLRSRALREQHGLPREISEVQ